MQARLTGRVGIRAIKFQTVRILLFLGEVFVAVAVVVA